MYLTMDLCCCFLATLKTPGWRPRFPNPRTFPLAATSGVGCVLCAITLYTINDDLAAFMVID